MKRSYNPLLRFELNDQQTKSTPWHFDNSPPMAGRHGRPREFFGL